MAKARRLIEQDRFTEADIELARALRYDPNHPQIHRMLATLHWQAGNIERVLNHVSGALVGSPDDSTAHYLAGRCFGRVGQDDRALSALRTALLCSDFGNDPEVAALCHYHLAQTLEKEGYLEASLGQYVAFEERAAKFDKPVTGTELAALLRSSQGSTGRARSAVLEKLRRFLEAADALAPLASAPSADLAIRLHHARLLMLAGRLDRALTAARAISSNDDETIELLFSIHRHTGHPHRIVDDLRKRRLGRSDDPGLLLALTDVLVRLDRTEEAGDELKQYLSDHPDAHRIRKRLIQVHARRLAWDDALRVCADGLVQDPSRTPEFQQCIVDLVANPDAVAQLLDAQARDKTPAASYLRGVIAIKTQRWELAEALFRKAHAQQPQFVPGRIALARLLLRLYRYEDALQLAARADQDKPEDVHLEQILGEVYDRLDDLEQAELHFRAAAQLDRTNNQAMLSLARLYDRSGRRLQSQRQLRVLLDREPTHEAARELLAYSYLNEGKRDVAIEQFEQLARLATTPTTKDRCRALLAQVGKLEPAADAYRRALIESMERHGPDAKTYVALAESYDVNIAPVKARDAFRNALTLDPQSEQAATGLVRATRQLLDFEEGARLLESLLKRRPNRHSWRLGLSNRHPGVIEFYWWIQDNATALATAQAAEARDDLSEPWRRRYRIAILESLRAMGKKQELLEQLQQWAASQKDDDQEWSIRLAEEFLRQDQAAGAIEILARLYESDPQDRPKLSALATALASDKQFNRAGQCVLDWLVDDPQSDEAIWQLAGILANEKRIDDALELIRNHLLHTFARERSQNLLIALLSMGERYDESMDLIEDLIDEAVALIRSIRQGEAAAPLAQMPPERLARLPDEPFRASGLHQRITTLRLSLAETLIAAKDYNTAKEQLTAWLEETRVPGERFECLRRLAFCHQGQRNEVQATKALSRALLLEPGNLGLNNDVAYGWIDQGIRLDQAEPMIRYALSARPRQAAYLDTYGWLMYKKGEVAEANKWLTRAKKGQHDPDAVILDHLGDALWRSGRQTEAIESWTAAVSKLGKRPESEITNQDERRVLEATPKKLEDAKAGKPPQVAPLAVDPGQGEGTSGESESDG